ncbi:TonB-dependent receptor [bacterium]|nr:TonB-dependent receptor [bacterium]
MLKHVRVTVILTLICCLCLLTILFAGTTGKISGKITDSASREPLIGVNVIVAGTSMGAATDVEGDYFIINVPPGTYIVEARMMGYTTMRKTNVLISVDRVITVNFEIAQTILEGQEVTVVAEREIVPMDVSASAVVAEAQEILDVPMIQNLDQFLNLQVGVENDLIRGGGLDQTGFMMNGLIVVDNRTNQPMVTVNLSAMQELSIIKGGFDAEYGNVRSGMINVVTKEGQERYSGSIDFRYTPAYQKHKGPNLYNWMNWENKPYLDPDVMWDGTDKTAETNTVGGYWDAYTQQQYNTFVGWNNWVLTLPANKTMTPEEARDLYMWEHLSEGADKLGQKIKTYGDKPDINIDVGFGGPVPFIGKYLGNLSFFVSHRTNWDAFRFPVKRDYYREQNTSLKLTSRVSQSIKLSFDGLYTDIESVGRAGSGSNSSSNFSPDASPATDQYINMLGFGIDHILSPSTFYNIRISRGRTLNHDPMSHNDRNMSIIKHFGLYGTSETPWGEYELTDQWTITPPNNRTGGGGYAWDFSSSIAMNVKGDLTSQIDKYNQIKTGFQFNMDDIHEYRGNWRDGWPDQNTTYDWKQKPIRVGAYLQDKIEFEGMIANVGLRLDYNDPNTDWFAISERYSKYYSAKYKDVFEEEAPREPAKGHVKISPRLGISHPISDNAKLYFNYGHFYSMPSSNDMYSIRYRGVGQGIQTIGNPSADIPVTVSYELGVEYDLMNMFLIHLAGYYKDSRHQTNSVRYVNATGTVDYNTYENNNFSDVRGFELRIDKRWGAWFTGWIQYTYMATSSGYLGRLTYYEDLRTQMISGLQTPYPTKPLVRPILRGNLALRIPRNWGPGPTVGGAKLLGDLMISAVYTWQAGSYRTWDPLTTYELINNLQWTASRTLDLRISKNLRVAGFNVQLFADINNPLDWEIFRTGAFEDDEDQRLYIESLHLPMYDAPEYKDAGYTGGDDKLGDKGGPGTEKDYINMPNREYLMYFDVPSTTIGCTISL